MKYQFIEQYQQEFPVVVMCRVLGVSESGYYAWRKRPQSRHKQEDARLTTHIQDVFVSFRGVYGSPRIHAELRDQGGCSSRKRIARLMQENGMDARRKPFHPVTTKSNPKHAVAPNLLGQDFTAERPNARVDGRYYVYPNCRGMAVPGGSVGRVFPARRRLGPVRSLRRAAGGNGPAHGPGASASRGRTAPPYGSWQSIYQSSVSAGLRADGNHGEHERERQLLR